MEYNFFLSLRTQYENLGDYLIAQATVDFLAKKGKITIDIRSVPFKYIELFNFSEDVSLVKEGFTKHLLKNYNKKWIYIIKPGGYNVGLGFKDKTKNILMGSYFRIIKKTLGSKVIKMPHSLVGDLAWSDIYYNNSLDKIFTRDHETFEKIQKSCNTKSFLVSDMAMFYFHTTSKFREEKTKQKDKITISLRFDRTELEPNIAQEIVNKLNKETGLTPLFVSQVTFDNNLNKSESKEYGLQYHEYKMDKDSLLNIRKIYSESSFVISNRLHSLLLGFINGAIPIALIDKNKDMKIVGCLKQLGIKFFYMDDMLDDYSNLLKLVSLKQNPVIKFDQIFEEL